MKNLESFYVGSSQLSPIEAHAGSSEADIFDGPSGYSNGVVRASSGNMLIKAAGGKYEISGSAMSHMQVDELFTVVHGSGSVEIESQDAAAGSMIDVHRHSGSTNITANDRTAIIVSGHSGSNSLDGFTRHSYQSQQGTRYSLFLPDNRPYDEGSWCSTAIRVTQSTGSVQIQRRDPSLEQLEISTVTPFRSIGRSLLRRRIER